MVELRPKVALTVAALCAVAGAKPNIVLFIADDCTRFDLACYGSKDSRTPAIDGLAAQGMRFTNCHQAAPTCSPTRHNLYTGLHPIRTGAHPNHTFARAGTLSMVQRLKPLGYRVALAGKRHIGPESVFPFEHIDAEDGDGPDFAKVDAFLGTAASRKEPFCLVLASNQPHSPWTKGDRSLFDEDALTLPPHQFDNPATRRNFRDYLAEINFLDGQVKSALDLLGKHGLADSTAFFFVSEQGNSMPFAKWTCYNAGLGAALIVRWPGAVAAGTVSDALVEYSDLVPTFLDLAGGAPAQGLDGSTLIPVLRGKASRHKDFSYGMMTVRGINGGSDYFPIRSIADGRYRLIVNYAPDVELRTVAEMPGWEQAAATSPRAAGLVGRYRNRPPVELYDDRADPWNLANLAGSPAHDSVRAFLHARLAARLKELGDDPIRTELTAFEHMHKRPCNGDSVVVSPSRSPEVPLRKVSAGVRFAVYPGVSAAWPDFAALTPARTGIIPDFERTATLPGRGTGGYAVRYTAFVSAPVSGYHTFYLESFNSARVSIDGRFIVGHAPGPASDPPARRYGAILLDSGRHAIEVDFLGGAAKDSLSVRWSHPGLIEADGGLKIPAGRLAQGEPVATRAERALPGAAARARGKVGRIPPRFAGGAEEVFDAGGRRR